jgi:hypothetical protein
MSTLEDIARFWVTREHERNGGAARDRAAQDAALEALVKRARLKQLTQQMGFAEESQPVEMDYKRSLAEKARTPVVPKPPNPPNVGSFEDYVVRKYGSQPTPEQIAEGRKVYQQADDRPRNTNVSITPTAESNILNRLVTQWSTAIKPARDLSRQAKIMDAGLAAARRGDLAAGSQAVLVTFQKILDPTSVVRESEYARSAAGQALLARMEGIQDRLMRGGAGVPLPELEKFAQLAKEMVRVSTGGYIEAVKARIGRTADHYKLPHDLVFDDYDLAEPPIGDSARDMGMIEGPPETAVGGAPRRIRFDAQGNPIQ